MQLIVNVCQVFKLEKKQKCSNTSKGQTLFKEREKGKMFNTNVGVDVFSEIAGLRLLHERVHGFTKSCEVIDCSLRGNLCGILFFFFSASRNRKNTHQPFSAIEPLEGE